MKKCLLFFLSIISFQLISQDCDLSGEFQAVTTLSSQDQGIMWDDCVESTFEGTVIWELESANTYKVFTVSPEDGNTYEDMSMGAYYPCYDQTDSQDGFPNGDLRIVVNESTFEITGASQWDEVYSLTEVSIDGSSLSFQWTNDYGEGAFVSLQRSDDIDWSCAPPVVDADGDGFDSTVDCNDLDPNINPEAMDIIGNGIDENCDGADAMGFCNIAGETMAMTTLSNQNLGIMWDDCEGEAFDGTLILEEESANTFIVFTVSPEDGNTYEDMSMGAYYPCYDQTDSQDGFPNGDLRLVFDGEEISITGASQWDEVYTISNVVADGANLSFDWVNDYGEGAAVSLTRVDGASWMCEDTGEMVDNDGDGVDSSMDCDDNDAAVGASQEAGTACDDGDDATTDDVIQDDGCACQGTIAVVDIDEDGVPAEEDCNDEDATIGASQEAGTACDDGDEDTTDDMIQDDGCSCQGSIVFIDADADGVPAEEDCNDEDADIGAAQEEGTACDDGDDVTINDVVLADGCTCAGEIESAVHDINGVTISIHPNPTSQFVFIEMNNSLDLQVNLYNLAGELVDKNLTNTIDLIQYSDGMYFIEVRDKNSDARIIDRIILSK